MYLNMSYECIYCNFSAPTNTRLKRHLSTQKHARNQSQYEEQNKEENVQEDAQQILNELVENIEETIQTEVLDKTDENEEVKLCENIDCERYPPDWDFEEDTEETYQQGQWAKCSLCPGYFNDDGLGDVLFIEEEPNNQESECDLCGKTQNIVQMKGTGQYLCGNACDEEESEEESENEKESVQEEDTEKIANCDLCCKDKSFETYYVFKRGRKQELFSCVKCWENRETQLVEEGSWTWTYHTFPGPAFYTVDKEEEDAQEEEMIIKEVMFVDEKEEERILNPPNDNILEEEISNNVLETIIENVEENDDIEVPIESFFLDIEYIKMANKFNDFLTTHPFILQMISIFMNIVKWFRIPQGGEAPL